MWSRVFLVTTVLFLAGCITAQEGGYAPVYQGGYSGNEQAEITGSVLQEGSLVEHQGEVPARYAERVLQQSSQLAMQHTGPKHRVTKDETLFSIAADYNVSYRQVAALNNLSPPYRIYINHYLLLPEGASRKIATKAKAPAKTETVAVSPSAAKPVETIAKQTIDTNLMRTVADIKWQWPAAGHQVRKFSAKENRQGVDILGNPQDNISAAADGQVAYTGENVPGYGKLILIRHNNGYLTAYANNETILVKEGQDIKAGDTIAVMGAADNNEAALYFEVRLSGKHINPEDVLPILSFK